MILMVSSGLEICETCAETKVVTSSMKHVSHLSGHSLNGLVVCPCLALAGIREAVRDVPFFLTLHVEYFAPVMRPRSGSSLSPDKGLVHAEKFVNVHFFDIWPLVVPRGKFPSQHLVK